MKFKLCIYKSNFTIMQKLSPKAIIEAGMRAESGKPIERPLGSPNIQSEWQKLFLNPVYLFKLPIQDGVQIQTTTTYWGTSQKTS